MPEPATDLTVPPTPRAHRDSWWSYPATYSLVGINVIVFLVMLRFGPVPGDIEHHRWSQIITGQFSYDTFVRFGGCDSVLVLGGQWWRLLTATFVHATVLHIAVNMWCLWNLGLFGERLLGRFGMVAVYVLTGVAGNMFSLASSVFTGNDVLVIGASGAVFGVAGILIVLLSNRGLTSRGIPWRELNILRGQVILFAVANFVLGVAPGYLSPGWLSTLHMESVAHIDNSAHLGGLVFGLLLGAALFSAMLSGKAAYRLRQRIVFASSVLVLGLFGYALSVFAAVR